MLLLPHHLQNKVRPLRISERVEEEIGLRFLFNTLADAKRPDLVLQMVRQEEHPSYMRVQESCHDVAVELGGYETKLQSHRLRDCVAVPFWVYTSLDNYPERDCDAIAQAMALQFGLVPAKFDSDVMC
jgi:hypothetical protein